MNAYDIIGDIHGEADALHALLQQLGYHKQQGVYAHPYRKVIFVGDFIDRGPKQMQVIDTVKPMVEAGRALAVMGNHEFNAIAYATEHKGRYLRPHNPKNQRQHQAFLNEYADDAIAYAGVIEWFKTLPLWLDLPVLRVIHACWDSELIDKIKHHYGAAILSDELLVQASTATCWEYDAVETLLKGKELALPAGCSFKDKDGVERHAIRIKWWQQHNSYQDLFIGPSDIKQQLPRTSAHSNHRVYPDTAPPVFIGHYWLYGTPAPLAANIACTDFSVAKPGGHLVAYRFDGETTLSADKFIAVPR